MHKFQVPKIYTAGQRVSLTITGPGPSLLFTLNLSFLPFLLLPIPPPSPPPFPSVCYLVATLPSLLSPFLYLRFPGVRPSFTTSIPSSPSSLPPLPPLALRSSSIFFAPLPYRLRRHLNRLKTTSQSALTLGLNQRGKLSKRGRVRH